jgi:SfnB family sulfur acquisition oxidoreductase
MATAVQPDHSFAHVIESDEEALDVARSLALRLAEGASERDRARTIPTEQLDWLSQSGILGITVPRAFGGADVRIETVAKVFQTLSMGDAAIGQLPQNHFVFVDAIRQDGTAEQKAFFFAQVLSGARFGNAQAERGGTSALDLKTRLTRDANGKLWLNGKKYYCTGALTAHWIPVAALDEKQRLVLVYVGRDASGVTVESDWNAMGQRTTYSGTTTLESVEVDPSQVVAHWRLFERPSVFHALASLLHAAVDVGIAQDALLEGAAIIRRRDRPRLGASVTSSREDPLLLHRLGQLSTRFHAAEALLESAARSLDRANQTLTVDSVAESAVLVGEAKAFAEDVSVELGSEIIALIGSAGTDETLNLNRHWRNARTHSVHDANQWRYHASGNWLLNGLGPSRPLRKASLESGPSSDTMKS